MNLLSHIFIILTVTCSLFASQIVPVDSIALSKKAWAMFDYAETLENASIEAMVNYQNALDIGIEIGDHHLLEMCYGRIAFYDFKNQQFTDALSNLDKAIINCNKHNYCKSYKWNTLKAYVYYKLNNYSKALKLLGLVEKEAEYNNDSNELYNVYYERKRIYNKIDLFNLEIRSVEKLFELAGHSKQIKENNQAEIYQLMANQERRKKDYKSAITLYKKSIKQINKAKKRTYNSWEIESYTYNKIGDCYSNTNDFENAEKNYIKAYSLADSVKSNYYTRIAVMDLCELYTNWKNYKSAGKYLYILDSLKLSESQINIRIRKNIVLGRLFHARGDMDSSLLFFKKSLSLFEKQINNINIESARSSLIDQESEYFSFINSIYKDLIQSDQNQPAYYDSLFKYSNIIRSRTLTEKKNYQDDQKDSLYLASVRSLKKFQKKLRSSRKMTEKDDETISSLKYQLLNNKLYQYKDQIESINQISLNKFKEYLQQSESTALIYNLNPYDQYVIVIDFKNTKIINLNLDTDSLSVRINRLLKGAFFSKDQYTFNTKLAFELYHDLFQPIEQTVTLNKNIIIIPDKPILSLPFDILLDKPDQQQKYGIVEKPVFTDNFLVNKYNFSFLPSANLVKKFEPLTNDQFLIIANPNFDQEIFTDPEIIKKTAWAFEPLLFSKLEAKSVKQVLKDAIILEDDAADFTTVTEHIGKSSIIHFATHAFVDTVFDMFSGLVLSMGEDSNSDGFLMGYDISNLRLNCDLITLSACESGRGRLLNNEGIMGLPRLFFAAGARSTLMSLWKVSDKFSAEFIPRFYKNLVEENMSKTEALGDAKRFIIQKYNDLQTNNYYNNPYYWATYSLYGDVTNNISYSRSFLKYFYFIAFVLLFSIILIVKKFSKN